jgi:hypothetical protein
MAQSNHAGSAIVFEHGSSPEVQEWQQQTPQGFGTTIVLSGNAWEIQSALKEAQERGLIGNQVVDPEWKFEVSTEIAELIDRRLLTGDPTAELPKGRDDNHVILTKKEWACAYIFGEFEQTYWVLGQLPLFS